MAYASVVVEGGLFPADLLDSIAAGAAEGQRAADFGAASGRLTDTIQSAFADARSHWDSWQRRRLASALPDARLTRQDWGLKLAELLGYGELHRHRDAPEVDGRSYAIYAAAGTAPDAPPVHIVGSNQSLDRRAGRRSPHALVQEYLNNGEALWGIVSNGLRLRLLRDSARFTRPTYLEFNLEGIIEGNQYAEFALLYRLLHRSRLPADGAPAHECLLESYYQQGLDQHGRVRERLRDGVESALIALGNGFLRHPDSRGLRRRLLPSDADADADADAGNAGASSGNGANRHGGAAALSATDYYRQLLRLVYRLLFLMTAEERGMLAPAGEGDNANSNSNDAAGGASGASGELYAIYHNYYSVTRLRGRAERPFGDNIGNSDRRRAADLWPGLQQTFRLFRADAPAALLGLKALDGELFGADGCPDLENAAIANYDLLRAMLNLSTFRDDGNVRRRVNYAGIDVEEFGSVYESLLDFHPQISRAQGLEFSLAAGSERKQTGSYYTPPELVRQLVDSALEPVLAERLAAASAASSAAGGAGRGRRRGNGNDTGTGAGTGAGTDAQVAALLALKVCDPAAGSGHFLLAAARRIARRVAQLRSGEDEPAPLTYRAALRDTIRNCIYAVDRNPLAVDLCKVALWIEGHEPGLPLSFLDHRIKCGDSLVGLASWDALDAGIPNAAYKPIAGDDKAAAAEYGKRNRAELKGRVQLRLGDDGGAASATAGIAAAARELGAMDDTTAPAVQAKAAQYAAMRAAGSPASDWWRLKVAGDLWTAAFFIPKQPADGTGAATVPTTGVLRRHLETDTAPGQLVGRAVGASDAGSFLHWPLEFPEVFQDGGGFDVVLGNPPWERIKLQGKEFFATRNAAIAGAPNKAARDRLIAQLRQTDPELAGEFDRALHDADAASNFARGSGRFPLAGKGDVNTYQVFAELARRILNPMGRAGIIVPTGICTDNTTKDFFADLVQRHSLVSLYDFENRDGVFPGVHKSIKFSLLTVGGRGQAQEGAQFAFFLRQAGELDDASRRFELSPADFRLFNPNTGTCPIFRTQRDLEITRKMYQRTGVLWREAKDGVPESNPWGVNFDAMFHMSGASTLFRTREQLESEGWQLEGNDFVRDDERYVPLYEAKLFHQYDHRFASFDGVSSDAVRKGNARNLSVDEKADPDATVIPRYWVPEGEVAERLGKDINSTNVRTPDAGRRTPDAGRRTPDAGLLRRNPPHHSRGWMIAIREVTGPTNQRTVISVLAPVAGFGHTAPVITLNGG